MEVSTHAPSKYYDVFISFRGEDTRNNFTGHLHSALERAAIRAYIDDFLQKGDNFWPALSQAIEDSHVAIVVFSENYASSKWCLKELAKILDCRKSEGLIVVPVFHDVNPTDVRYQRGAYGNDTFERHRQHLLAVKDVDAAKSLLEWRDALTEAANICGHDTRGQKENEVIEEIVKDVLEKLKLRFPDEVKVTDLVGFDKICKDIELLLPKQSSKNVQILGIWGMGGMGKTTIAKAFFSKLFPKYDSVCFLEIKREASPNIGQSKLESLREKLLSELLKDDHLNSKMQTYIIIRRLSQKRIFVVLDDVDGLDLEELDVLCRDCSNAAHGSKLIITTRDKHLLSGLVNKYGSICDTYSYDIKTMSVKESLELFCLSAFNERHPKAGYEDLSKRAVDYAGGVPLALKVLGANLGYESTKFWESELKKLKKYPYDKIQNVLQVSYDGLEKNQKEIFLDIAFFFKDERKDFTEKILYACGFSATSGLKRLEDKALITILNGKRIQMHDLLQDMGLNIVHEKDPELYISRLRDVEEVSDVLQHDEESNKVKGIKLDLSQVDHLDLNAEAFKKLTHLRFLKLYIPSGKKSGDICYPKSFNKFFGKLRYFEWHGYSLKSLPETFCAKWLVEICMPHSHITKLWHRAKNVGNLERIDLSNCKHLKNLPDLSKAENLKWLNLSGCESLDELHPSILSLKTLETLTLDGCKKLISLKSCENGLKSLKKVSLKGCISLKEFSISSNEMERLDLNNAAIEELNSSIGSSSKLKRLTLESLTLLQNIPNELSQLNHLEELRISDCGRLILDRQKLHALFDGLRSLKLLHLKDCHSLSKLPDNISVLSKLRKLRLDGSGIKTLPSSIKHLLELENLSLESCTKLKHLPELPIHIKDFHADNCTSLVTISTLNNFASVMEGKKKYISFQNCMSLYGTSLHRIMKGAVLSAKSAIFHNVLVGSDKYTRHNYNFVKVCSLGSSVPEQFTYRTTESSFTIDIPSYSNILGLVYSAVLSPSDQIKKNGAKIFCQFYNPDGTRLWYTTCWYKAISELNDDHVYIWYDALHLDIAVASHKQEVNVEFYVTNALGERDALNISTKECGVLPIFDSDLPSFLLDLDLDFELMWELGLNLSKELEFDLGSVLPGELVSQYKTTSKTSEMSNSDENKSNGIHDKEHDQNDSNGINIPIQNLSERFSHL